MRVATVIRHVNFEDLGSLEAILQSRGYDIHYYDVHEPIAQSEPLSLLVVLGGQLGHSTKLPIRSFVMN